MFETYYRSKEKLVSTLMIGALLAVLLTSSLMPPNAFSIQPPIDTSSYYVGTIGQPARLDPCRAYDTASGELLQNIYQTLIWWNDKHPITFTPGVGYNLTIVDYTDLDQYGPVLCTEVPTWANGRIVVYPNGSALWRFTINTAATFQPWIDHTGATVPSRAITAADVVYSYRRQVIYDSPYSPVWTWMTPAFGFASWSDIYGGPYATYNNGTFKNPADEAAAATLIQNWCYNVGNDVYFYFQLPWFEGVLKQIFAQTWGGVINPDWVKEMGGWNGLFEIAASTTDMSGGWTNNYHGKPTNTRSELDTYKDLAIYGVAHGSKYASFTQAGARGAQGTGPYEFTSWDTTNKVWRIDYDPAYWMGWAQAGDKMGNYLHTVIWKGVDTWPTRKMLFLEGESDVCVVPRANMYDLLVSTYNPIAGINLVYNIAALQNDVMLFGFSVPASSPYQAYVGYPIHRTGPQQFFFNNTHIRRAFAWALNYTQYVEDAWFGEAIVQRSWWVEGLAPADYKNENASMPQRTLDTTEMQNELNQAVFEGFNVGTYGFEMTLAYNIGNDQRLIACNLIAQAFQSLGSKYKCNVVGLDWPVFLEAQSNGYLPMHEIGWQANFADPDDFCEPYQASWGVICSGQFDPDNNAMPEDQAFVDEEITNAMIEPDFNIRGAMYMDLQYRYWLDVASFPLIQPVGRRFARDWVKGWYYNALYPGEYAYDLYKSASATMNVDVKVVSIVPTTPVDPIVSLRLRPNWVFNVTLMREDANMNIANLWVAVALKLTNQSNLYYCYPNGTYCVLAPGMSMSIELTWDKSYPITRGNWSISAEAYPMNSNAVDNDLSDQTISDGMVQLVGYGKGELAYIPEDLNQDGSVSTFDWIIFSNNYGRTGPPGWIQADLMPDGVVDMFDYWMLHRRMGWTFDHPTNPTPEPWKLAILNSGVNYNVEVYSNYIVYSQYSFDINLKQLKFDITTDVDAFCNITIPKVLMSGNLTVYLDDVPKSVTVTENATHYSLYFESAELSHKVKVTSTLGAFIGDLNHDGWCDIYDAILLANAYGSIPGDLRWNPYADINVDAVVDIYDAILLAGHFNQQYF